MPDNPFVLSSEQRRRLLRDLIQLPILDDPEARRQLLARLPDAVAGSFQHSPIKEIDLTYIVDAVKTAGPLPNGTPAVVVLLQNVLAAEDPWRDLNNLVGEINNALQPSNLLTDAHSQRLLDLLQHIAIFSNPEGRDLLLRDLPASALAAFQRPLATRTDTRSDLVEIIRSATRFGMLDDGSNMLEILINTAAVYAKAPDIIKKLEKLRTDIKDTVVPAQPAVAPILVPVPAPPVPAVADITLDTQQFEALCKLLEDTFTNESLGRMVKMKMGEFLEKIVTVGSLEETVFNLVGWAEQHGRSCELIIAAVVANPNQKLHDYAQALGINIPI